MSDLHPVAQTWARHVNPSFVRLLGLYGYGRVFVRARNAHLWDHADRRYVDALSAFGAANLGHNPPSVLRALREFLDEEAPNVLLVGPSTHGARFAEALARAAGEPLSVTLFSCSGAEAVDGALKLARAATGRKDFLYCREGYHGLSLGPLSLTGSKRLRAPFEPLLADGVALPFGDLSALEEALAKHRPAAFVVEPVVTEGGVLLAPDGYLARARDLCRQHQCLLVFDEVQTGLGRTGTLFAFQRPRVTPDVLVLGKSLGGSLAALSATVTTPELFERAYGTVDRFDLHGATLAGNALACAAGLATLRAIEDENLSARAESLGSRWLSRLRGRLRDHPLVKDVRGAGLLVGVELGARDTGLFQRLAGPQGAQVLGQWIALRLLEEGVLCQPCSHRWDVLRLEPPLTIDEADLDRITDALSRVLDEHPDLGSALRAAGQRLGRQFLAGWAW